MANREYQLRMKRYFGFSVFLLKILIQPIPRNDNVFFLFEKNTIQTPKYFYRIL